MTSIKILARRVKMIEALLPLVAALVLFFVRFGHKVLNPSQIDWLLSRNDPAAYYLVWDFFRYEPWSFPLGRVTNYLYPLGTSLPLADGLPLLAYPAKLFSSVLPETFQFFGLWHLICAVLQAYFGYRIVRRFIPYTTGRLLGSLLFLLAPVYLFREGHIALSSHWVILAALDLYFQDLDGGLRRASLRWCLLCAVTALIHPYLMAMILLVFAGVVLKLDREQGWPWFQRLIMVAVVGFSILLVWWAAGNLSGLTGERIGATGFGHFSMNLNGMINPKGCGVLLPQLPQGKGQYEGFAYLGAGWLLIATGGFISLLIRRDLFAGIRAHRALVWILGATFVYALSNIVMWNETTVVQYMRLPVFDLISNAFRCSGRFVWPVIYGGMAGLIVLLSRLKFRWPVAAFMALALVLQVWDIHPLIFQKKHFASMKFQSHLADPNWETAARFSSGITTIPPFKFSLIHRADYRDFCWLATRNRIPSTAGYAARMSLSASALSDSMRLAIANGQADSTHLYVCDEMSFPETLGNLGDQFKGSAWDGYYVCFPRDWPIESRLDYAVANRPTLSEFLASHDNHTVIMAVRDEATAHLSKNDRKALENIGFDESNLVYRGSAVAVVNQGRVAWQQLEPNKKIELSVQPGDTLGTFVSTRAIDVVSAGYLVGNLAELRLDGHEQGFGVRGFNIMVLDADQKLIELVNFDTHAGKSGVVLIPVKERT